MSDEQRPSPEGLHAQKIRELLKDQRVLMNTVILEWADRLAASTENTDLCEVIDDMRRFAND